MVSAASGGPGASAHMHGDVAPTACCSHRSTTSRRASRERSTGCSTCLRRTSATSSRCWSCRTIGAIRRSFPARPLPTQLRAWADSGIEMFLHGLLPPRRSAARPRRRPASGPIHDRRRRRIPRPRRGPKRPPGSRAGERSSNKRPAGRSPASSPRPGSMARARSRRSRIARSRSPKIMCASGRRQSGRELAPRPGDHLGKPHPAAPGGIARSRIGPAPRADPVAAGSAFTRPTAATRRSCAASTRHFDRRHETGASPRYADLLAARISTLNDTAGLRDLTGRPSVRASGSPDLLRVRVERAPGRARVGRDHGVGDHSRLANPQPG